MINLDLVCEARRRGALQRAAQGLPPFITDPTVSALAAAVLTSALSSSAPTSAGLTVGGDSGAVGTVRGSAAPASSIT